MVEENSTEQAPIYKQIIGGIIGQVSSDKYKIPIRNNLVLPTINYMMDKVQPICIVLITVLLAIILLQCIGIFQNHCLSSKLSFLATRIS